MKKVSNLSSHVIRLGFITLVVLVLVAVVYSVKMLFLPLTVSILLATILQPAVNFLETRFNNRLLMIVLLYVAITAGFTAILFFVAPWTISEVKSLAVNFPDYEKKFAILLVNAREYLQYKFPSLTIPDFYQLIKQKLFTTSKMLESVSVMASGFFSVLSMLVLIPVMVFFFLADGHLIQKAILRMVPNRYFEMIILLIHKILGSIESFIRGQLIDAFSVTVMTSIGLAIIGLPYCFIIGLVAGIGNLIPYLGPFIGFLPAFFTLAVSPEGLTTLGIIKLVSVFVVVQFLEGTFIYPLAVGKSVNLHPLIVIIGITVGGQLGGIIGMLISVPVITIVKVTIEVVFSYLKRYSIL